MGRRGRHLVSATASAGDKRNELRKVGCKSDGKLASEGTETERLWTWFRWGYAGGAGVGRVGVVACTYEICFVCVFRWKQLII